MMGSLWGWQSGNCSCGSGRGGGRHGKPGRGRSGGMWPASRIFRKIPLTQCLAGLGIGVFVRCAVGGLVWLREGGLKGMGF